jgi:putative transposase
MIKAMLESKVFCIAAIIIAGIEIMHIIPKGPLRSTGKLRLAQQFYSLAV